MDQTSIAILGWLVTLTMGVIGCAFWAGGVNNELRNHKDRLDGGSAKMKELEQSQIASNKVLVEIRAEQKATNTHLARIEAQNKKIWEHVAQPLQRIMQRAG
jgi:hypothetical protein